MKLDFRLFDDLEIALSKNPAKADAALGSLELDDLGPAIAFCRLHRFDHRKLLSHPNLSSQRIVREFASLCDCALFERMPLIEDYEPRPIELAWVASNLQREDARWKLYRDRLRAAARKAGFSVEQSDHLSAAAGEMTDNAVTHSQSIDTSLIGYKWEHNRFEFVVSDLGIGICSSLKSSPRFATLVSDVEAIRSAVVPGNSRFDQDSGHGFGFQTLIQSLHRHYGAIRIHSGGGCLDLQGDSPSYGTATLRNAVCLPGTIISVACRPS